MKFIGFEHGYRITCDDGREIILDDRNAMTSPVTYFFDSLLNHMESLDEALLDILSSCTDPELSLFTGLSVDRCLEIRSLTNQQTTFDGGSCED